MKKEPNAPLLLGTGALIAVVMDSILGAPVWLTAAVCATIGGAWALVTYNWKH